MTTLLFTIAISASYRGTQEIYSAQVIARNGENLYHLAEALSIPDALEKVVEEMRLQEKKSASVPIAYQRSGLCSARIASASAGLNRDGSQ